MNTYAKAVLYIYPGLDGVIAQIDDLVLRKALASFSDNSSCLCQAERILEYIEQKDLLISLKSRVDAVLDTFGEEEIKYFEYKYFKRKPKSYFQGFDASGRQYFRVQIRLLDRFCRALERRGLGEETFFREYMQMDFIRDLVRRIEKNDERAEQYRLKRVSALKRPSDHQRYSLSL